MVLPALSTGKPPRVDFLYGAVVARGLPALPWRRAHQAALLLQQPPPYYEPPDGDASLRRALQGYLAWACGLACVAEQIVIVHGSLQAIDLCARVLLDPGDAFAFKDPGYLMARRCVEATGARLLPVPVDDQGLETVRLPEHRHVRLVCTTPSHQFPLAAMLPIGRRQELLRGAARRQAWIIEDDDGEFRHGQRPIDALHAIDEEGRVIYAGTFSKAFSPQLRLGYLVLPSELLPVFRQAKRLSGRHAPVIEQRTLASLIDSGAYERHVRRIRRENERRRGAMVDALGQHLPADACVVGTAAGLHAVPWLPMLRQGDEAAVVAAAGAAGVGAYPLSSLCADRGARPDVAAWAGPGDRGARHAHAVGPS